MIYVDKKFHTVLFFLFFIFLCLNLLNPLYAEPSYRYAGDKNNVQLGIYPGLQIVDKRQNVYGFRFNFPIAENSTMIGVDMGGASRNTDYFYGLGLNLLGIVNDKNAEGVSLNCIFSF